MAKNDLWKAMLWQSTENLVPKRQVAEPLRKQNVQPMRTRGGRDAVRTENALRPMAQRQKGGGLASRTGNAMAKKGSEYRRRLEEQMSSQRNWGRRKFK